MHLEDIEGKQELAAISMDNYRNKLLKLDLNLGIAEVSLCLGTFFTSAFGMNLMSGLETKPFVFYGVSAMAYFIHSFTYSLLEWVRVHCYIRFINFAIMPFERAR